MPQTTDVSLSREQIQFALDKMSEWILITGHNPNAADVGHSCLLQRLLSGKPALEKAPPCSYSCPNYPLGEGEKVQVRIDDFNNNTVINGYIVVDQSKTWKWYDKEVNILLHVPSEEKYQLTKEDDENFLQKIS